MSGLPDMGVLYEIRLISSGSFRDASEARGPGIQIQTQNLRLDSGFAPEPVIGPAQAGRTRGRAPE
jgi:hypothetical protein